MGIWIIEGTLCKLFACSSSMFKCCTLETNTETCWIHTVIKNEIKNKFKNWLCMPVEKNIRMPLWRVYNNTQCDIIDIGYKDISFWHYGI